MEAPTEGSTALVWFDQARQALMQAKSVDEVKELRDKAEALRLYTKQAGEGLEMQNWCAEIKLRAERRAGELLKETVNHQGSRGVGLTMEPTLPASISKQQSHRWQTIATLPEEAFESHIATTKGRAKELTTVGVYKLAKDEAKEARREAKRQAEYGPLPDDTQLCCGDFMEWGRTIPDASIDLILTDPPYGRHFLHRFDDLGALAARVLKPGGSLVFMYGQMWHYEMETQLRRHLTYQWEQCYHLHGSAPRIDARRTHNHWRPIYWFINGQDTGEGYVGDFYKSEQFPVKEDHDWEQSRSVFRLLVKLHTSAGDLILDPFVGSGPSGVAAIELRRRFIGIDIDAGSINMTKGKLVAVTEADKLAAEMAVNTLIAEMELELS